MKHKEPKIKPIILSVCSRFGLDPKKVTEFVKEKYPEVLDKEVCANCGASMAIYQYTLDSLDSLFLIGMGKIVAQRVKFGVPFTEANKVHLQSNRSTQCSKLGLIAKVKNEDGTHDSEAGWLITNRGFAFLRGEPVPKTVTSFRNKIVDHGEEEITLSEIHKKADVEYYNEFAFHKRDWVDVSGHAEDKTPII